MLLNGPYPRCEEAEKYYYDFVYAGRNVAIPREIVHHMDTCRKCQGQLEQLKTVIGNLDSGSGGLWDMGPTKADVLRLHFAFTDEPIGCGDVRPFLPTLLDPSTEVGIPTPITAHIEKCSACRNDLQTIRGIGLKAEQLQRLSQVFSENGRDDSVSCTDARTDLLFTVLMTFRETDSCVLRHICCCQDCRRLLYEHRASLLAELCERQLHEGFPCQEIKATDIFDYVVPYGLDPSGDQYAKFRESLTSHLRDCPTCIEKMQQLHETVYGIAERDESDVVTVFHVRPSDEPQSRTNPEDIYGSFPVAVDVLSKGRAEELKAAPPRIANSPAAGRRTSRTFIGRMARVAAVLVIAGFVGSALLFNSQNVQADRLGDIRAALVKADHMHVKRYSSDGGAPVQEEWISRSLNFYLVEEFGKATLYNLEQNTKTTRDLLTSIATEVPIPLEEREDIRSTIAGTLDLVPYTLRELSKGADPFRSIIDEKLPSRQDSERIYELTVADNMDPDYPVLRTRRFYLHPETNRPYKVMLWQTIGDGVQVLQDIREVAYPDEDTMWDTFGKIAR